VIVGSAVRMSMAVRARRKAAAAPGLAEMVWQRAQYAPPESVRRAATANGLPVDAISEVRVLDPYFYTGPTS
jgi:hypothetical protein